MKNFIIALIIFIAAWYLFQPRKSENGTKKESIFSDLISGVYEGSKLIIGSEPTTTPIITVPTTTPIITVPTTTAPTKPPLISTSSTSSTSSSTGTSTTSLAKPALPFTRNIKPLTPFR